MTRSLDRQDMLIGSDVIPWDSFKVGMRTEWWRRSAPTDALELALIKSLDVALRRRMGGLRRFPMQSLEPATRGAPTVRKEVCKILREDKDGPLTMAGSLRVQRPARSREFPARGTAERSPVTR
eukprot:scaffold1962_cov241-Pinguiococcus_pyrenoidosus.AAC.4